MNILNKLYSIEIEKFTCPICHEIAFPPVKWFVIKPESQHTPLCNHVYCLNCTRTYFQLSKKISDRTVNRFECLLCQQQLIFGSTITGQPKNASDIYYHCNADDCKIIKLLIEKETNGVGKKCHEIGCEYRTTCPEEMKNHCRNDCEVAQIKCFNQGCTFTDNRKFVYEHLKICPWTPLQCKFCHFKKHKTDLQYHYKHFHKILEEQF